MHDNTVCVPIITENSGLDPVYSSQEAAGADLFSTIQMTLLPGGRGIVPTGVCIELPPGYVGCVCSRSGLAAKYGIAVLNAPGIVDSDYRGEIKVILINLSQCDEYRIMPGDRIAQLLVMPVARAKFTRAVLPNTTERGTGGFGSTGM